MITIGSIVRWGDTYLSCRVKSIDGDYAIVEVISDLRIDVDARVRKFWTPGTILRIHISSLDA